MKVWVWHAIPALKERRPLAIRVNHPADAWEGARADQALCGYVLVRARERREQMRPPHEAHVVVAAAHRKVAEQRRKHHLLPRRVAASERRASIAAESDCERRIRLHEARVRVIWDGVGAQRLIPKEAIEACAAVGSLGGVHARLRKLAYSAAELRHRVELYDRVKGVDELACL